VNRPFVEKYIYTWLIAHARACSVVQPANAPYVPVVEFDCIPRHADESVPQTYPKTSINADALLVAKSGATVQLSEAIIQSHSTLSGVDGSFPEACQPLAFTVGQEFDTVFVGVYDDIVVDDGIFAASSLWRVVYAPSGTTSAFTMLTRPMDVSDGHVAIFRFVLKNFVCTIVVISYVICCCCEISVCYTTREDGCHQGAV